MKFSGEQELLISQWSLHALDIPLIRICLRCFYSETSLTPLTHSIGICICVVFACVVKYLFVLFLCLCCICICICIVVYPYLSGMFLFRDQLTTSHPLNPDCILLICNYSALRCNTSDDAKLQCNTSDTLHLHLH